MLAHQLVKAGRLTDAIAALEMHLEKKPHDRHAQTFLYELTCFKGDFEGADQMLSRLSDPQYPGSKEGVARYRAVLKAERERQRCFAQGAYPQQLVDGGLKGFSGTINGEQFLSFSDTDPRIGDRLEIFVGGEYFWMLLADVQTLRVPEPRKLRDLLWLPVELTVVPTLRGPELKDVWVPMMTPLAWQHPDEEVKLGMVSDWMEDSFGHAAPYGIKSYLVDGREMPLAEIREVTIRPLTTLPVMVGTI